MSPNLQQKVGDLAVDLPSAARVFEMLGIDYCCGREKSLEEACVSAGASTNYVLDVLEHESGQYEGRRSEEWISRPLTELMTHIIERHHAYTKAEFSRLDPIATQLAVEYRETHPEILKVRELFCALQKEVLPHMLEEEQVLFPYIVRLEEAAWRGRPLPAPFFETRDPVRMFVKEHQNTCNLLREMRTEGRNYAVPSDACADYLALYQALPELEKDLHEHMHLENNILFRRTLQLQRYCHPLDVPQAAVPF